MRKLIYYYNIIFDVGNNICIKTGQDIKYIMVSFMYLREIWCFGFFE